MRKIDFEIIETDIDKFFEIEEDIKIMNEYVKIFSINH